MKGNKAVIGVYSFVDDTLKAIEAVKSEGHDFRVYSPVPVHSILDAAAPERSPISLVTGTGALLGIISGFSLCIWCHLDWPIRVSAKEIASIPAFIPVGYECTILFGAIFTLLALLHFCKLPWIFRSIGYDPRFSQDKFGVVVACDTRNVDGVKATLSGCGADEVNVQDAL